MKINFSKKILIVSIGVFIVTLSSVLLLSGLLINKINNINDKIHQLQISTMERENNILLGDLIIGSETDRKKLEKYFIGPGDIETAVFIGYLESLAKDTGLVSNIRSVGYETGENISSLETISFVGFDFSVSGKWNDVFNFVKLIENLPKVSSVNSVSLEVNSGVWSADIDLSVAKLKN